jgi:hypothetical protein
VPLALLGVEILVGLCAVVGRVGIARGSRGALLDRVAGIVDVVLGRILVVVLDARDGRPRCGVRDRR